MKPALRLAAALWIGCVACGCGTDDPTEPISQAANDAQTDGRAPDGGSADAVASDVLGADVAADRAIASDGSSESDVSADVSTDVDAHVPLGAVDKVDLLFVIDNSPSTLPQQQQFGAVVPALLQRFVNPLCVDSSGQPSTTQPASASEACPAGGTREFPPVEDMHIGVISTSLGGHGADSCSLDVSTCNGSPNPAADDRGHLLAREDPCSGKAVPTYQGEGFLAWDPRGALVPPGQADVGEMSAALGKMILGTGHSGCGYESAFESWYRFLVDPSPYATIGIDGSGRAVPNGQDDVLLDQRSKFLRPDSLLIIAMLSDENDCSVKEYGQFYFALQQRDPANPIKAFHLPRARSVCATDPNDPCCKSCGQAQGTCPADPSCTNNPILTAAEDDLNLRCFDQKRRFGIDFLYPIDRYTAALTSPTVTDRAGNPAPNPIFVSFDGGPGRDPSRVLLLGIVGVPWQDLARDPNDAKKGLLSASDFSKEDGGHSRWDDVGGDPMTSVPPLDPFMVESTTPRSGTNPFTGEPITPAGDAGAGNSINGRERTIANNDLEYACTYPLSAPIDCSDPSQRGCECAVANNDNPVCAANPANGDLRTLQVRGVARPSLRSLALLRSLGNQGIAASICAPEQATPDAGSYAYQPAVRALLERARPAIVGQ